MTPVEVARYVRCFQRAVRTGRVHSRLIRRDGRYDESVVELIRAVLPRTMFQMLLRRGRGYELVWQGTQEELDRLRARLPHRAGILRSVRPPRRQFLVSPYDGLLDEAVEALPILSRFRQDEAAGIRTVPLPEPEEGPEDLNADVPDPAEAEAAHEAMFEGLDDRDVAEPIPVTRVVPPAEITAAIAEAARTSADRVPTNVAFPTECARRFAEAVARATRGGRE